MEKFEGGRSQEPGTFHEKEETKMTKILWLSRHAMTEAQLKDLRRIYGENISVVQHTETVQSAQQVLEIGKDVDILAVVLPPNLIGDLVNPRINTKPVIRAKSSRVETGELITNPANGQQEKEFMFQHTGWEQVVKIEIVVKPL